MALVSRLLLGLAIAVGAMVTALFIGPDGWGAGGNFELIPVRLPRVLGALVAGCALGMAGAAQQGVFRNPLADPGLTGVFGGALLGLGVLFALAPDLAWEQTWRIPAAAGLGALAATSALLILNRGRSGVNLILAGLGINALAGAGTLLITASSDSARTTLLLTGAGNWLGLITLELAWLPLVLAVAAGLLLLTQARGLDRLSLGEHVAQTMGTDVKSLTWRTALLTSLAAGAATCLCGPIAFIGLLAPHVARRLVGATHQHVLPAAGWVGGLLLLLADTAGRAGWLGLNLPAGALVALVGAPAFIWLARRHV